nr:MAG TPA: hypothetical protein [Caudoviricetes sp.]DAP65420.1 MAG TPA: hypothetical protein [Caudoviricetes sp.]
MFKCHLTFVCKYRRNILDGFYLNTSSKSVLKYLRM